MNKALINNNFKAYDFTEVYKIRLDQILQEKELANLSIDNICEGFEKVRQNGVVRVVDMIFKDLDVIMKDVFGKLWYENYNSKNSGQGFTHIEIIMGTIEDYMVNDVSPVLNHVFIKDIAKGSFFFFPI